MKKVACKKWSLNLINLTPRWHVRPFVCHLASLFCRNDHASMLSPFTATASTIDYELAGCSLSLAGATCHRF